MTLDNSSRYLSPYSHNESVVLSIALVFILFFSLLGNLIIMVTLYKNNKLWISTNILIGNLSMSSLGVTVFVMPFSLYSAVVEEWTFKEGTVCNLTGFSASLLLLVTIFTHTAVSIDKYFGVVKPLSRAFTPKRTWIIVGAIWTVSVAMSLGPLVGVERFEFNPTTLICGVGFPKSSSDSVYLGLLGILGFIVPTTVMLFVYIRVYFALRQQSLRLLTHAIVNHEVLRLQKRLILTVLFSWICFTACWATFFFLTILAVVIKDRSKLPYGLGVAAYWTGYSNSVMNPLIICSMSSRFKEGFFQVCKNVSEAPFSVMRHCRRTNLNPVKSLRDLKSDTFMTDVSSVQYGKTMPSLATGAFSGSSV